MVANSLQQLSNLGGLKGSFMAMGAEVDPSFKLQMNDLPQSKP
jgi:hypothetical protein